MKITSAIQSALEAKAGAIVEYDLGLNYALITETRNLKVSICLAKYTEVGSRDDILYHIIDANNCAEYAAIFAWYFYDDAKKELHNVIIPQHIADMMSTASSLMHKAFKRAKHVAWMDCNSHLELHLGNSEYLYFSVDLLVFYRDIVKQYVDAFEQWFEPPISDAIEFADRIHSISKVDAICEEQLDTKLRIKYRALLDEFIANTEHEALHKCYNDLRANEQKCRESIVASFKKAEPTFDDDDVAKCIAYVSAQVDADLAVNEGLVCLSEAMYNWQATNQVSFDLMTLAEILYANLVRLAEEEPEELGMDSDIQSALDLLRSQHWSEILDIAYIPPMYLMK